MQTLHDLINEMQSYGLLVEINKIVYNKIGRCPTKAKPSSKNGWYIIFQNGDFITAFYGDHQQDKRPIKWCSKQRLSQQEKQKQKSDHIHYQQQLYQEKQQRLQNIRSRYEKFSILGSHQPHGYLLKKVLLNGCVVVRQIS